MSVLRVWRARSGCLACWMFNRDTGGSARMSHDRLAAARELCQLRAVLGGPISGAFCSLDSSFWMLSAGAGAPSPDSVIATSAWSRGSSSWRMTSSCELCQRSSRTRGITGQRHMGARDEAGPAHERRAYRCLIIARLHWGLHDWRTRLCLHEDGLCLHEEPGRHSESCAQELEIFIVNPCVRPPYWEASRQTTYRQGGSLSISSTTTVGQSGFA